MGLAIPNINTSCPSSTSVTSTVGGACWKKGSVQESNRYALLGLAQIKSYAILQLKNNFCAWLLKAKENMQTCALPTMIHSI